MKQKKWMTSKQTGNELENLIKQMLDEAKIPYKQESTVQSGMKRVKGSVDFELTNPVAFFEAKRYTKALTFGFKSETLKLKWSQVEILNKKHLQGYVSGILMQETHDLRVVFVPVSDFLLWWSNTSKKSITLQDALQIGRVITDFNFLNVDTSEQQEE